MEYGTGAIMAVPAHDERDFAFAPRSWPADPPGGRAARTATTASRSRPYTPHTADERMVNSGQFDGMRADEALRRDRRLAGASTAAAKRTIAYRLRDWLISRQRYWGCADPGRRLPDVRPGRACRTSDLPVLLPEVEDYAPEGALAAGRGRGLAPRAVPEVRRPGAGARPTRWTRSSTRPGTSSATSMPATPTAPGIATRSTGGCRSTSTSAASSTRSCTCCTRASS